MNKTEFDERQLYLRGDAFKHGFILLLIFLFFDALLKDNGIYLFEGMWGNILIITLSADLILMEMAIRDIIDFDNKSYKFTYLLFGGIGCLLLVMGIVHLLKNELILISGASLTQDCAFIIMDIGWVTLGLTYFIKAKAAQHEE